MLPQSYAGDAGVMLQGVSAIYHGVYDSDKDAALDYESLQGRKAARHQP